LTASYLIRFDDICPTHNWRVWTQIEAELNQRNLKPLLAVVPDNQDSKLKVNESRLDFWDCVRRWQSMGWAIGLHGYQHRYVTQNSGMIALNARSEFAGLPMAEQEDKLRRGLAVFEREGVRANAWIAPAHSFDSNTVALLHKLELTVISDGYHTLPYTDAMGMTWVPQQLWQFRPKPSGVWTVCYHHNHWTDKDFREFVQALDRYASQINSLSNILKQYQQRHKSWRDSLSWQWNYRLLHAKARLGGLKRRK